MDDIKPFLIPPPEDPAINHPEIFTNSGFSKLAASYFTPEPEVRLSEEELHMFQEMAGPDSARLIRYFEPKLDEHLTALIRQIEAIEKIAQTASIQADQAIEQTNTSKENLALFKEQVEKLSSIATDAKSQADTVSQELEVQKKQFALAKAEAEGAKKDAAFSKTISIIALFVSIAAIIIPMIFG